MITGIPFTTSTLAYTAALCIALMAFAVPHLHAQQAAPAPFVTGAGEDYLVVMGVGMANGARLGVQYRVAPQLEAEASFGYVRMINYLAFPNKPATSIGITPSLGISFLSTDAPSTKALASFLVSYQVGSKKIVWAHERRIVFSLCIGSELRLVDNMVLQLRAGPSMHILLQPIRGIVQTFMHYDGGLGWRF
ncbi:MAG: hypothetical protein HY962_07300 [Ignavibacteriae bacterium]|nr:hypothetical protein [Ignavibacteriota bacterium]